MKMDEFEESLKLLEVQNQPESLELNQKYKKIEQIHDLIPAHVKRGKRTYLKVLGKRRKNREGSQQIKEKAEKLSEYFEVLQVLPKEKQEELTEDVIGWLDSSKTDPSSSEVSKKSKTEHGQTSATLHQKGKGSTANKNFSDMPAHDEVVGQTNSDHLEIPKSVEYKADGTQSMQGVEGLASASNS
jgi:hypothetical protein